MPSQEKVVRGLEQCSTGRCAPSCPYVKESTCTLTVMRDAAKMIKERPKITLCADCIYLGSPDGYSEYCRHLKKFVTENWYCADGIERSSQKKGG